MDLAWHATDPNDWEYVLPPDGPHLRRRSSVINDLLGESAFGALEKHIPYFKPSYDHVQAEYCSNVVYSSQTRDTVHAGFFGSRIAAASRTPVEPSTEIDVNSSVSPERVWLTKDLLSRSFDRSSTASGASPENPTSIDAASCCSSGSPRSHPPITVEPSTWQVPPLLQHTRPSQLHPDFEQLSYHGFQHPASSARRGVLKSRLSHSATQDESYKNPLPRNFEEAGLPILSTNLERYITADTNLTKRYPDHVIPGLLDFKHNVDAAGDTAAKYNFLNEAYAKKCNFKIDSTFTRPITIASGRKIMTTGIAEVSFCFRGERTIYPLKFHILPGCIKNVILGKSFLKATKTFSDALNFTKRVVKRFTRTPDTHQVLFLGASPPVFAGLLNGETKTALADSASKVLILDEDYARMLGLSIVSTKETCIKLRFADGSTAFTSGQTYSVSWQFGTGKCYPLDFYILKNAPADVILSEEFLLTETQAFIEYADWLVEEDEGGDAGDYDDSDDDIYFFAIYRDEDYHPQAYTEAQGAGQYFEDDREASRREEEDLHIASLAGTEKDVAIARAQARRAQWAAKQAANSLAHGAQHRATNTTSLSAAPQLQTSNAAGVPSANKRQWWLFRLRKKHKPGPTKQNP